MCSFFQLWFWWLFLLNIIMVFYNIVQFMYFVNVVRNHGYFSVKFCHFLDTTFSFETLNQNCSTD